MRSCRTKASGAGEGRVTPRCTGAHGANERAAAIEVTAKQTVRTC